MSKKLFVIIPALYECGMFSGSISVRHFIVIFGVHYNDPVKAANKGEGEGDEVGSKSPVVASSIPPP